MYTFTVTAKDGDFDDVNVEDYPSNSQVVNNESTGWQNVPDLDGQITVTAGGQSYGPYNSFADLNAATIPLEKGQTMEVKYTTKVTITEQNQDVKNSAKATGVYKGSELTKDSNYPPETNDTDKFKPTGTLGITKASVPNPNDGTISYTIEITASGNNFQLSNFWDNMSNGMTLKGSYSVNLAGESKTYDSIDKLKEALNGTTLNDGQKITIPNWLPTVITYTMVVPLTVKKVENTSWIDGNDDTRQTVTKDWSNGSSASANITSPSGDLNLKKIWEDDVNHDDDSITLKLMARYENPNAEGGVTKVPAKNVNPSMPTGADTIVLSTVTNTNDEKTSISVEKKWVGPALKNITIILKADGKKVDEAVLSKDTKWKHVFKDLRKYDAKDGHEIKYTVAEKSVDGYLTDIEETDDGFIITNTISEDISIPVKKVWKGAKLKKVTVRLWADGDEIDSVELSDKNNWEYVFRHLDMYDENGNEIEYEVTEDTVKGYTCKITGDAYDGFTVTNTKKTGTSKTGDERDAALWGTMLTASAAAAAWFTANILRRKKDEA